MKKFLFPLSLFIASVISAQETPENQPVVDTTKAWSIQGQNTLMLNQAAFSN